MLAPSTPRTGSKFYMLDDSPAWHQRYRERYTFDESMLHHGGNLRAILPGLEARARPAPRFMQDGVKLDAQPHRPMLHIAGESGTPGAPRGVAVLSTHHRSTPSSLTTPPVMIGIKPAAGSALNHSTRLAPPTPAARPDVRITVPVRVPVSSKNLPPKISTAAAAVAVTVAIKPATTTPSEPTPSTITTTATPTLTVVATATSTSITVYTADTATATDTTGVAPPVISTVMPAGAADTPAAAAGMSGMGSPVLAEPTDKVAAAATVAEGAFEDTQSDDGGLRLVGDAAARIIADDTSRTTVTIPGMTHLGCFGDLHHIGTESDCVAAAVELWLADPTIQFADDGDGRYGFVPSHSAGSGGLANANATSESISVDQASMPFGWVGTDIVLRSAQCGARPQFAVAVLFPPKWRLHMLTAGKKGAFFIVMVLLADFPSF